MNRTAPAFGAFLLALTTAFLAAFGRPALADPGIFALCSGLLVGAALSIASGLTAGFTIGPVRVSRNVLLGSSHVAVAIAVAALGVWTAATAPRTSTQFVAIGMAALGAPLARMGVRTARDGRRAEPGRPPSPRHRLGVGLLVVGSIGAGLLVAALI